MIVLLISIVAVGLTIFLYYKNLYMAPLRILSLIILYLLITGFTLSLKLKEEGNLPAVLVDYSASMARYFPSVMHGVDGIDFSHSRFFFSESLFRGVPEDSSPSGRFTNITRAIVEVNKLEPSAIILLSDGNHNYGNAPFTVIEDMKIPVYCFGVGAETKRDVAIVDVMYPDYGFVGDSVTIEVIIQSKGFEGGEGSVELESAQKKAEQSKSFSLSDIEAKQNIGFSVYGSQPGEEKFLVRLVPQPGETTYENNEYEFSLHTLKKKMKILYYTDHVSFNTKFILRALGEDTYADVEPLGKLSKNNYFNFAINQKQTTLPALNEFDILLLDNINCATLPWTDVEKNLKRGMGIFCLGTIEGHTDLWRDILPLVTVGAPIKGSHQIEVIEPFSCFMPGEEYPPFSYINRVTDVKENAVVIARANQIPIIAYRGYGAGMVFQIIGADIGTWQFLQEGLKQKNVLSCLMADITRFISPTGQNKRLILKSVQRDYTLGGTIDLTLQSFDHNFKLTGGGDFYLEYAKRRIPFFEVGDGIYKTSLTAEESGNFHLKASGSLDEEKLVSNELEIRVLAHTIEIDEGLNRQFLQTLSAETGGKYYSIDELGTFNLPLPKEHQIVKKFTFDSPLSYLVIVCLLAIDWFLRRRRGTI